MIMFHLNLIAGFMVGLEFPPPEDEESFVMVLDLGILRISIVKV